MGKIIKTGLSTSLGPLNLFNKIFIGAGAIKTVEDVRYASTIEDLALILIGSYTVEEKPGNNGETYYYDRHTQTSLNSIGLRNGGIKYLREHLPEMVKIANDAGKILGISVSGETPRQNAYLIKMAIKMGVQYFEVNSACGNVLTTGTDRSKPLACYNYTIMEQLFETISNIPFDEKMHYCTIKVGKYLNFSDIDKIAELCRKFDGFNGVVTNNTEKTKILKPDGKPVIDPDNGFGGMGGKPLFPGMLGQVSKWHEVLADDMDVIAIGGIFTGDDIMTAEKYGASAMQYVTSYLKDKNPDREMQGVLSARYMEILQE